MEKNLKKGFTLIELLVVIAIIGILSSVVIVSLNNARSKARDAARKSNLQAITTAIALHASEQPGEAVVAQQTAGCPTGWYMNTVGTTMGCPDLTNGAPRFDTFMGVLPVDGTDRYSYKNSDSGAHPDTGAPANQTFCLAAVLENDDTSLPGAADKLFTCTSGGCVPFASDPGTAFDATTEVDCDSNAAATER